MPSLRAENQCGKKPSTVRRVVVRKARTSTESNNHGEPPLLRNPTDRCDAGPFRCRAGADITCG